VQPDKERAMWFVVLGVALTGLKLFEFGPVAQWSWWWVVAPYFLALAWWGWSDASGMTRRREIERDVERKQERRRRNIDAMGLGPKDPNTAASARRR
jgi:small Trp-rich protein